MKHRWVAAIASFVLAIGAAATSAQQSEGPAAVVQDSGAACYRQSDLDARRWQRLDWSEQSCFAEDSCHGGLGGGQSSCFKWARGPNAPALPWSAEVAGDGPAGNSLPTDEGLPLELGLFASHTICAENPDQCVVTRWRANERVPIYAGPDQTSRRVARINRNEVIALLEHARFSAPQRGVATSSYNGMNAGDVVYAIEDVCNARTVWRRGDLIYNIDDGVEWEPRQRLRNPSAGYWVRLERANGQIGWARFMALSVYFTPEQPSAPESQADSEYDDPSCE
jgi:hypothetical protein